MASGVAKSCSDPRRTESGSLPLPYPFPEYVTCPHCGELEIEVWCYEAYALCHRCGAMVEHIQSACESQCLAEQIGERAVRMPPPSAKSNCANRSELAADNEPD